MDATAFDVVRLRGCVAIAAGFPRGAVLERRVLAQDSHFELAQLGSGLDSELIHQRGSQLAVRPQSFGLTPGTVERQQPLMPEALAQRMVAGQRLKLGDRVLVPAAGQQRVDPRLERAEAFLLEPRLFDAGELGIVDVSQRQAPPQRQ